MKLALFGHRGRVGSVLVPALEAAGHEVRGVGRGEEADLSGVDAAVDFTQPDAAAGNVRAALELGVPAVVGTSGLGGAELVELDALALDRSLQLLVVPNFAIGAVLMMRFAEAAAEYLPRTEIIELHDDVRLLRCKIGGRVVERQMTVLSDTDKGCINRAGRYQVSHTAAF